MIEVIAQVMTDKFVEKSIIKSDERSVYTCGCGLMISEFISTSIVLIMGVGMGKSIETVIYLITFTGIRIYAGGYHAGSYNRCIITFSVSSFIILTLVDWIICEGAIHYLMWLMVLADIVIFILAPVEDYSRNLTCTEKTKFKKISRIIVGVISIVTIATYYWIPPWRDEVSYVVIVICEISILLIVGVMKNYILTQKKWNIV